MALAFLRPVRLQLQNLVRKRTRKIVELVPEVLSNEGEEVVHDLRGLEPQA